eukprot:3118926-Amphidinium_carterae.6
MLNDIVPKNDLKTGNVQYVQYAQSLKNKWLKHLRRKPQYISGRNMYVSQVVQMMHVKNARERVGQRPIKSTTVIQTHARHWHALSAAEQAAFNKSAIEARRSAEVTRAERLQVIQAEMDELNDDSAEEKLGSVSMTFSGSALT